MADPALAPYRGHDDPLALVDRTDIDYAERLAILQDWQVALADVDAPESHRAALQGAIHALEMGAAVQDDGPDEAPDAHGYGVPEERSAGD